MGDGVLQNIYQGIRSKAKQAKAAVSHPLGKASVGALSIGLGGWLVNLAGRNFDWPAPVEHQQYRGEHWYAYGDVVGVSALAVLHEGGRLLGDSLGASLREGEITVD